MHLDSELQSKVLLLLALLLPGEQAHAHLQPLQLLALLVLGHHATELRLLSRLVCEDSRSGLWHVCCCRSRAFVVGAVRLLPDVRHDCPCPILPVGGAQSLPL
jgi:hypothetical protein